ncbi:MAG: glutamine--fructose-6-phosphate transaminase (isomerizing), partial [Gammaproteobacteria bacterium]
MCGIVGAAAQRNVAGILLEGLKRLEYRGYDSAGLAVLTVDNKLNCTKRAGKVSELVKSIGQGNNSEATRGKYGIAHTRWATHGVPSEVNAHPHVSTDIAVVHNGIIENHQSLRTELIEAGYRFASETDSEVVAHLVHYYRAATKDLKSAVQKAVARLEGAYALAVLDAAEPDVLIGTRHGSPLVLGVGIEENFLASDPLALRQVTDRFVYLAEGDVAEVRTNQYLIYDGDGQLVERDIVTLTDHADQADKGGYRHYMLKEIYQQPQVLEATLQGRASDTRVLPEAFGESAPAILQQVENIHIIACGTSYHAGLVARYWLEDWAGTACQVEVASEYRYRSVVVPDNCLFVSISQSGETADTLAALKAAKQAGYLATMTICNVANSSLVRESDLAIMTQAGPEIGVASTKAFTTQLVALQLLSIALARYRGQVSTKREAELVKALHQLPDLCRKVLALDEEIEQTFESFADKHHALFLGRGVQYPIALEGALKLKEISYIHAEAYPSGELKHGPLALVDADMPVIAVAPNNEVLEKLKSNLHEVQARGGQLFVFADAAAGFASQQGVTVLEIP